MPPIPPVDNIYRLEKFAGKEGELTLSSPKPCKPAPAAPEAFRALPEERQKTIVTFVNAAETQDQQSKRILETIDLRIHPKKKP